MPIVSRRSFHDCARRAGRAATVVAVTVSLSGCVTGERPSLVDEAFAASDDPVSSGVAERLELAQSTRFTATYDIISSLTGDVTTATVVASAGQRRVTIGTVEYVSDGSVARTCDTITAECVDFLDDARVSNLNITHRFWGQAFAARLRLDASRRFGDITGRVETIAGQPAACADIPVPGLRELTSGVVYCALDAGPLARYFGADVSIELTSFSFDVDDDAFDF